MVEDVKCETQEDRFWFLSQGCIYTPVMVVATDGKTILTDTNDTRKIIAASNNLLKNRNLTAKVLISPLDGKAECGGYALRSLSVRTRNSALALIAPYGIHSALDEEETQTTRTALQENGLVVYTGTRNVITIGNIDTETTAWALNKGDRSIERHMTRVIDGYDRMGYLFFAEWIRNMYATKFSIYGKNKNFPVRNVHFMGLRIEALWGQVPWEKVNYEFPESSKDSLAYLANRPRDTYTSAMTAAARGFTLHELLRS